MALIKTIEEVKRYVTIDKSTRFESLIPYRDEAEILFIKRLIGEEFYDEIQGMYDQGSDSQLFEKVLPFIQRPLVNYMLFLSVSTYGVSYSDIGIQVNQHSDSAPAPQWKIHKLEESWLNSAYTFADVLLKFLEENAEIYVTWATSDQSPLSKKLLINSASEFPGISGSRRTFMALMPFVEESEAEISALIGKKLYKELKEELESNSVSENNEKLLKRIRPVVASYTLLEAIPILPISVTADAVFVNSFNNGISKKDAPSEAQMRALISSLQKRYEKTRAQLKMFLTENIENYPLYAESLNHTANRTGLVVTRYNNKPGSKNFLIG